jgi:hypothetical protein
MPAVMRPEITVGFYLNHHWFINKEMPDMIWVESHHERFMVMPALRSVNARRMWPMLPNCEARRSESSWKICPFRINRTIISAVLSHKLRYDIEWYIYHCNLIDEFYSLIRLCFPDTNFTFPFVWRQNVGFQFSWINWIFWGTNSFNGYPHDIVSNVSKVIEWNRFVKVALLTELFPQVAAGISKFEKQVYSWHVLRLIACLELWIRLLVVVDFQSFSPLMDFSNRLTERFKQFSIAAVDCAVIFRLG